MRDSCIFYRSFYESIKDLTSDVKVVIYDAIFSYSLDFVEPELTGLAKSVFTLIKPQLDANIKRYSNGKTPKKKQKISKTEAKHKQSRSKTEAKPKLNTSKPEANNNVNKNNNKKDNEKGNENKNEESYFGVLIYPDFDDFWNLYDKKVGDKEKLKSKWNKLTQRDKENIMEFIPKYIQSQPDKKYRKNPETFLNNKSWYDEIINNNYEQSNRQTPNANLKQKLSAEFRSKYGKSDS